MKIRNSYFLVTFGCQMNEYDSAMIAETLESAGARPVESAEEADLIVVNTCSVRAKAEESVFNLIRNYEHLKRKNPLLRIAVVGCMAQSSAQVITQRAPYVDFIIGTDGYSGIATLLDSKADQRPRISIGFDRLESYEGKSAKLLTPFSTMIAVQRGCNLRCSYCIVPLTRGPEKYRQPDDLLREARAAVERGVVELTLLGQTVNGYRYKEMRFADLLHKLAEIPGLERIRFTSPHPIHFSDRLIKTIGELPQVCKHLHLPLQSGSNRILSEMRRIYTREKFLEIVEKLRSAAPEIALSTDLIAGFPGETEEEFEETLSAMKLIRFDGAFMFAYSERPGTEAAEWEEQLSEEEKNSRLQRMIELQNRITIERAKEQMGKVERLLVEKQSRRDEEMVVGRTDGFRKVLIPAGELKPGQFVTAKITSISGWTLLGEPIA